ncbi:hypothetical protein HOG16_03000 [Candidatus Woesearchaeota archaeon]|jgi:hypothetical protein|nr:hypothetical protein [Candidatus Woesearchaeota archaeon]MBT4322288.1 hypothetical protein [Candidatus Woesearchaeota archaeon]MBT4630869.1 hypothetical protein [Candidatus Woesearchaeota archaeon]
MAKLNQDEVRICDIAGRLPGAKARLATPQEDHGFQKADVVVDLDGITHYLQVSRMPKSVKERDRLARRGTHPINTHKYHNMPLSDQEIYQKLEEIIDV